MKLTRIFGIIVGVLGAITALTAQAQERAIHFTMPDGIPDTVNIGEMSWSVRLEHDNIWLHNPTDDTLVYGDSWGSGTGDFVVFLFDSVHPYSIVVPPHDSGRVRISIVAETDFMWVLKCQKWNDTTAPIIEEPLIGLSSTGEMYEPPIVDVYPDQYVYHGLILYDDNFEPTKPMDSVVYYNDQGSLVTIQTLFIPRGSHFTLNRTSAELPVTLAKGQSITAYFTYGEPDTIGYYDPAVWPDTIYWDLCVVVTDTTYPVSTAAYNGVPAKPNYTLSTPHQVSLPSILLCSPNPVSSTLTLSTPLELPSQSVEILDATGKMVRQITGVQLTPAGSKLDVESLPAGMYFVRAGNMHSSFIKRK